jgi:hypothetical protein
LNLSEREADFSLPIQIADVTPEEWQLPTDWALNKIKVFERDQPIS